MAVRNLLTLFLFSFLYFFTASGQNYTVINDATVYGGCNCYRLTSATNNQGGGVYQNNTINLNNSFDYTFSVFLGCNTSGADGIVFILTNNITGIGAQGGGLGYQGLQGNSLAVEFDTYQNSQDPAYNHIAIESQGSVNHNVGGPVPALPSSANIDDCAWHTARIVWDVNTQTYSVYMDGSLRITYTGNIVNAFFGGNPIVNWGWSGSTGGANNDQRFCVNSTSSWVAGTNYQSCSTTINFHDISTSNVASVQSWKWNFGEPSSGAANTSTSQNPSHTYAATGVYTVTLIITDISGCPDTFSHIVTINPPITITPTITQPTCNGASNGSIVTSASGGFGAGAGYGGYAYSWSNNINVSNDVGLTAGTYNVTVTDGVCSATSSYTLSQPPPLTATTSHTDAPCGSTGSATITISGGTPPYTGVTWDGLSATPGPSTYTTTGLAAGVVVADFHDANGCSALLTYKETINTLPCGYTLSTSSTNVTCFGGSNGTATLNVTGSIGTVNITWTNAGGTTVGTGSSVTGLPAGIYTYNYSDGRPQTFTGSVTINQPGGAMTVGINTQNTTCSYLNNGSAVASVTANGASPYTYSWSASGQGNSPTATGLSPGVISVSVTDNNGCSATASGTVSGQTPLSLTMSSTPDSCYQTNTGTTSVSVSGGTPVYSYVWSNNAAAIGSTDYNLPAGSYTVTVTDHNGCTATGNTSVTQPTAVTATMTHVNVACFGGTTGSATITPSGGNGGFTYVWSGSANTTATLSGVAANTYYVTATDSKLCSITDTVIITQPASAFTVSAAHVNVRCKGLPTGSITLTESGGTTPYGTVTWADGPTGTTRTNLIAGTYSYTALDGNNCQVTGSVTITEPATAFTVAVAHTDVSCFGNNNGSITLTPSGGTTPYATTQWLDGATGNIRSNLVANTYYWGDSDANGCLDTGRVIVSQPASAFTVSVAQTNVLCYGGSTGTITLTLSGGTTPYNTVNWRDGATGTSRTGLAAGRYSYIATDANGCTDSASVIITQPTAAFAVSASHVNVRCKGLPTGSITLTESGGTTPYGTVTWADGPTGTTRTNLAAGTYSYTAVDANNCQVTGSVTITEPATAFTVAVAHTDVSCFGNNNGSITLTPSGGTTPYATTQWLDGATGNIRSNLVANTYYWGDSDANGCLDTGRVIITQPASAFTVSVAKTNVSCFGTSTGTITLTLSGGTTPYNTVNWRDGATGTSRTGLAAGNYSYIATDANGCTDSATISITQPASAFAVSATQVNVRCKGLPTGSITLNEAGGTTPYATVTWADGPTGTSRTNLPAGSYTYTAQDANGCSATATVTITEPATAFTVTHTQTNVLCYGGATGTITLTPAGGTTPYATAQWLDGATGFTRSNLVANTYSYGDSDANGCLATGTITITQPAAAFTVSVAQTNVSCSGGSNGTITLTLSGGTTPYNTVNWRDGATGTSRTGLVAGNYSYIATDANGCTDSATVTITQPAPVVPTIVRLDSITCFGANDGGVVLNATGGNNSYTYALDGGTAQSSNVFSGLTPGAHNVVVTDGNGCTGNISFNTFEPTQVSVSITNTINDSCFGQCNGQIIATATGGTLPYLFTIDGINYATSDTFKNLCANPSYTITVKDNHGCSNNTPGSITEPAALVLSPVDSISPTCNNGSNGGFDVIASGGTPAYSYSVDGGAYQASGSFTSQSVGTHNVSVKDANGCTGSYSITVINPPATSSYASVDTNVLCHGGSTGSITINVTGTTTPYTYAWSYGSSSGSSLTGIPAGQYTVTVKDGNGCIVYSADSVNTITEPAAITATSVMTPVTCFGDSNGCITVTPAGGTAPFAHSWSNGASTANPCGFAKGSYTDTITDANACQYIYANISVTQPSKIFVSDSVVKVACIGQSNGAIYLTDTGGTPGYTYQWSNSSTSNPLTGIPVGPYEVTITDANHCTITDSIYVDVEPQMVLNANAINVLCPPLHNGRIVLNVTGGTPGYLYAWSNGHSTSTISGLNVGTYTATITDSRGCTVDTTFTLTNDSAFSINAIPDTVTINQGDTKQLGLQIITNHNGANAGTDITYTWDPSFGLSCADCPAPVASPVITTEYTIHAVTDSGCVSDSKTLITVIPQHQLYVPNTFTPNADGINDYWEVFGNKKAWIFCEAEVFDRWGEKIFQTNDINFQWDGKYRGTPVEPGVYTYVFKVVFIDNYSVTNKGTITIIR